LCAVIENGVGDGSDLSRLSTFSLRGARDLSQEAVRGDFAALASGAVRGTARIDLSASGIREEKLEGLVILPDRKTVLVAADMDFGFRYVAEIEAKSISIGKKGFSKIRLNKNSTALPFRAVPLAGSETPIYRIHLEQPLEPNRE